MGNSETASDDQVYLEMLAADTAPQPKGAETTDVFLANLSKSLKALDDVDGDLAAILSDHLLTVSPHGNAVIHAKTAIIALAAKRAAQVEDADG